MEKPKFTIKTENGHTRLQRNGHDQICPFATALALPKKVLSGVELVPDRMSCGSHCPFFELNMVDREGIQNSVWLACTGSNHHIRLAKDETTDPKTLKLS